MAGWGILLLLKPGFRHVSDMASVLSLRFLKLRVSLALDVSASTIVKTL